ncbi:hypothetical protein TNCV_4100351 [Trichonephila clavipes]|nr:hypothetical protein TNCV_4100351 [Trichonephila clavipes]
MKAVSVLEHFSDHGSIHQKMKKNTTSVRSYPNSAGECKTPYEEGLVFFHLKLLQGNSRDARGHQLEVISRHVEVLIHVKSIEAQTSSHWCGEEVKTGVPAQVSSSSLDHGSKLRFVAKSHRVAEQSDINCHSLSPVIKIFNDLQFYKRF